MKKISGLLEFASCGLNPHGKSVIDCGNVSIRVASNVDGIHRSIQPAVKRSQHGGGSSCHFPPLPPFAFQKPPVAGFLPVQ